MIPNPERRFPSVEILFVALALAAGGMALFAAAGEQIVLPRDATTDGVVYVDLGGKLYAMSGKLTLEPVEEPPPVDPPEPPGDCEADVCFELPDFTPTAEEPVKRHEMKVPAGPYDGVELSMTVDMGEWQDPTDGFHNVFWLVRNGNKDMVGYVNLLGPERWKMVLRHGIGMPQEEKPRKEARIAPTEGETYVFEYAYDMRDHRVTLEVWHLGELNLTLVDVDRVADKLVFKEKDRLLVDLSFTGENEREPTTIGWTYRDLTVRLRRAR